MATRKTRAPAHLLRTFTVQYREFHGGPVWGLADFQALTSTGAIVQAAQKLARMAETAVEIVATQHEGE